MLQCKHTWKESSFLYDLWEHYDIGGKLRNIWMLAKKSYISIKCKWSSTILQDHDLCDLAYAEQLAHFIVRTGIIKVIVIVQAHLKGIYMFIWERYDMGGKPRNIWNLAEESYIWINLSGLPRFCNITTYMILHMWNNWLPSMWQLV